MTVASPRVLNEIAAALPAEFTPAREIWQSLGCWSHVTVRHALVDLVEEGRAEEKRVPHRGPPGHYMKLFRRVRA